MKNLLAVILLVTIFASCTRRDRYFDYTIVADSTKGTHIERIRDVQIEYLEKGDEMYLVHDNFGEMLTRFEPDSSSYSIFLKVRIDSVYYHTIAK